MLPVACLLHTAVLWSKLACALPGASVGEGTGRGLARWHVLTDGAACLQEAYLTALRGLLLASGQRLSAPVLSKAGEALQSMMATAGKPCDYLLSQQSPVVMAQKACSRVNIMMVLVPSAHHQMRAFMPVSRHQNVFIMLSDAQDLSCKCAAWVAGDNEEVRDRIAGGLGGFAQHCSLEEVRHMMADVLAISLGHPADRHGRALTIAYTAQYAPHR